MLMLNDGRSELWQWDTGRTVSVDADCSQVHFSNKVFGRSIDVDVVGGVAIIPDVLLQTDKELIAWAFVGTSENGYTKISKVFKVNKRNKPADYVFTPPEQTTLGELIERLDKIEESQDPDAIKNAVDDYLANNPIEIDETDPTVPEWAKQPTKPSYTASEVGALSADTVIPTIPDNVSAFRNDAGYLTEHQDLTGYATERYVQGYAQPKGNYLTEVPAGYAKTEDIPKKPEDIGALPDTYTPPNQTAEQVGADPKGTAATAVSQHNTADDSHNDIRLELKAINDRLTAFFDSDDITLDELSEIVAYITSNKTLIESITTSKVSVADIVNNLTTNVSNKPLSAAQGVALKGLIDTLSNGKLDESALPSAINTALAQAKASGEFDGKDGKTPAKGVDYFTDEDIAGLNIPSVDQTYNPDSENAQSGKAVAEAVGEVKSDLDKLPNNETLIDNVAEVVKSKVPLVKSAEQPTFVNSVEECVDETKVYLLPDGNLYAYGQITVTVTVETVDNETNLLPTATDASGAVYNGKGYKEETSIEGDVEFSDSSCGLTGLIPITPTKGYVLGNNVMLFENFENPTIDKLRVSFYNSEKAHVHFVYGSSFVLEENYAGNARPTYKLDNNGCVERIDFAGLMSYMNNNMGGMPAYVRIALNGINDNSQIMFGKRVTKEETIVTEGFVNTDITYTPVSDIDLEEYRTDENIGNYLDNTIPKPTFTEGYIKYNDAVVESTTHKHSSYVEVKEQQPIIIENFNCLSQTYIFCYDENKKLIHKVSGKNGYVTSYEFIPPFGVKFIRYLIANDQEATNVIYYKDSIDRNYFEKALLKSWYETAHKKINVPFENATQFPMITLIDDDTPTLSSTKLYHDTLTALGVKGGFAVITSTLDSVTGLTEQLLGYEEEGFHMVIHSNTHTPSYRPEAENRDLVSVESDFVKGIRKMGEVGFVDYKFWCTPYGVADIDMQNLARKYGMNCLVSSGCDEIVTTGDSRGRFNIARFSFNYDTTGAILARAKELVDECVANNGWLLITTHFSDDGWDEDVSTFNEFVNYALSQGCKFKTLNEAFRIREPIYRLYEMF